MTFEGIYTPVITPFRANGTLDQDAWSIMVDHLIDSGVHGIVVSGTTGEFYALKRKERLEQFEIANAVINRRVPWVAGVNDFRTEDCCDYARAALEHGAQGLLIAAPPYSQPSAEELIHHCVKIDNICNLPIILYNYPGRTGTMMGEDFLRGIVEHKNFKAIKESSGDYSRIQLLSTQFPQLELSCGADDQALEFFVWGAKSWVCAATNCLAEETLALYNACVIENNYEKGRKIMKALLPVMTVFERGGKFVQCVKYVCELRGLPGGHVRQPLLPMSHSLQQQMQLAVESATSTIEQINNQGV
ncbi:MAG: dihydrodipicolinate synthase family protein [marine bacterium B5-7]|nr:MAG: dihydrodipicolinate synthase family protein [marine bacterium B5-7]